MITLCKQVINYNDEYYVVIRAFKESDKFDVEILKKYFHADTVLKKEGILYFTNKIETLEYEQISCM